ncbi:hypothetical protein [Sphingomonas sp. URHD0057]|uniref:hypothetical protein n=1 Tax=Sphingomonas sp. URHD0057 TaxID=1380389 RepID=UPI00048BCC65|nr:hypothetical protein [Sphingomonas sp. URHD0057]
MLNKISGLARALYILLAIITGFVALGTMDMALILVALGLISGLSMPQDKMILAGVIALVLPIVGGALGHIPAIGTQLMAVAANLQIGVGGALASAIAIFLYGLVMDGLMGLAGGGTRTPAAATH